MNIQGINHQIYSNTNIKNQFDSHESQEIQVSLQNHEDIQSPEPNDFQEEDRLPEDKEPILRPSPISWEERLNQVMSYEDMKTLLSLVTRSKWKEDSSAFLSVKEKS